MRDEAIIADRDQLTNEGMGLNTGALANDHAALDLNEGPDKDSVAQGASVQVDRLDNGDALAKGDINEAGLVNFGGRFDLRFAICECLAVPGLMATDGSRPSSTRVPAATLAATDDSGEGKGEDRTSGCDWKWRSAFGS